MGIQLNHPDLEQRNGIDLCEALSQYNATPKPEKTVIVQRDNRRFWSILFRQKFNLTRDTIVIRFAGEAAADVGGPMREFLTLAMKRFPELGSMIFGGSTKICFSSDTESILLEKYRTLGQLTGISILTLGRGPECLHPAIVRAIYKVEQLTEIEPVEDASICHSLTEISKGKYDSLYDLNISSFGKTESELKRMFLLANIVHTKFSAIEQFSAGMGSICSQFQNPKSYDEIKPYLVFHEVVITFSQIMQLFSYVQLGQYEESSNDYTNLQESIVEFELLMSEIESKQVMLSKNEVVRFDHLLLFCTGVDRLPPYGFQKLIDVEFKNVSLPSASTCGLQLTMPISDLRKKLITAIKFGGGFGVV